MPRYKRHSSDVFVDARNAHRILGVDIRNPRSRSAQSPKEFASKAYIPGNNLDPQLADLATAISNKAVTGDLVDKAAYLMYYNAMRTKELLSIKCTEISREGSFLIHAAKGSTNRVGYPGRLVEWLISQRGKQRYLFDHYNARTLYYQFCRKGIQTYLKEGKRRSVTHLMRHLAAKNLESLGYGKETIQHQLGHKSERSTDYYTSNE